MNNPNEWNQPAETIEQMMARMVTKLREEEVRRAIDEPEFRERLRVEARAFLTREFERVNATEGNHKGWQAESIVRDEIRKYAAELLKEPEWKKLTVASLTSAIERMQTSTTRGASSWEYIDLAGAVSDAARHLLRASGEALAVELRNQANKAGW